MIALAGLRPLDTNITVGDHITSTWFGFKVNIDTIYTTGIAGLIVIALGLIVVRGITSGVPNKLQLAFEVIVDQVNQNVKQSLGPTAPWVAPLGFGVFLFILASNWLALIPSGHHPEILPPATADTNTTFAMALTVFLMFTVVGIRHKGIGRYVGGFFKPLPLAPIKLIEEVAKPLSLALRLFGNIFAGGIMVQVIGLIPALGLWPFNAAWKLFDMFIGGIQAFIFAFLTVLYFGFAVADDH